LDQARQFVCDCQIDANGGKKLFLGVVPALFTAGFVGAGYCRRTRDDTGDSITFDERPKFAEGSRL
jgi:hypothetical protein